MASQARALAFRPARRNDAATPPNARAAGASNGRASKSDSACCRCAWRAARSLSVEAMSGPTDSSASVTAAMNGSAGSTVASVIRVNKITVLVSSSPRSCKTVRCVTARSLPTRRDPPAASPGQRPAARASGSATPSLKPLASATGATVLPLGHRESPSAPRPARRGQELCRRGFASLVSSRQSCELSYHR